MALTWRICFIDFSLFPRSLCFGIHGEPGPRFCELILVQVKRYKVLQASHWCVSVCECVRIGDPQNGFRPPLKSAPPKKRQAQGDPEKDRWRHPHKEVTCTPAFRLLIRCAGLQAKPQGGSVRKTRCLSVPKRRLEPLAGINRDMSIFDILLEGNRRLRFFNLKGWRVWQTDSIKPPRSKCSICRLGELKGRRSWRELPEQTSQTKHH